MQKLVVVLIFAISFCSCKQRDSNPVPFDFNFSFSFGYFHNHKISTFDSTFETVSGDRDTILKITFTSDEKLKLYKTIIKSDYLSLPDTITNNPPCQMPSENYDLEIILNSRKKLIHFTGGPCWNSTDKNIQRFDSIQATILQIIGSKKEIKNLPRSKQLAL